MVSNGDAEGIIDASEQIDIKRKSNHSLSASITHVLTKDKVSNSDEEANKD